MKDRLIPDQPHDVPSLMYKDAAVMRACDAGDVKMSSQFSALYRTCTDVKKRIDQVSAEKEGKRGFFMLMYHACTMRAFMYARSCTPCMYAMPCRDAKTCKKMIDDRRCEDNDDDAGKGVYITMRCDDIDIIIARSSSSSVIGHRHVTPALPLPPCPRRPRHTPFDGRLATMYLYLPCTMYFPDVDDD